MLDYSSLQSLVDALERGNQFHICVAFFARQTNPKLMVSHRTFSHYIPVCDAAKMRPDGLKQCMKCRSLAFQKARRLGKPYWGYCVNGVYEYCHPVFLEGKLYCMVCVGNILRDKSRLCRRLELETDSPLLDTMETALTDGECETIAAIVESYIHLLRQQNVEKNQTAQNHAVISAVKGALDRDFAQDVSLASMAQTYYYNEKYLGRIFKAQVGMSFGEYLNRKRLRYAAELLRQDGGSVLEISQRAGFQNVTYFNRLFRAKYGMSPSQYRKKED